MVTRLTEPMRTALQAAARQSLRRVHTPGPGKPPWPAHASTLAALLRHELVDHGVDRDRRGYWRETWTITDQGRAALTPPQRRVSSQPKYLQREVWRGGDTTTEPHRSIDYEIRDVVARDGRTVQRRVPIDVVDADLLDHRPGRHRHAGTQNRRAVARQLTRNARPA